MDPSQLLKIEKVIQEKIHSAKTLIVTYVHLFFDACSVILIFFVVD